MDGFTRGASGKGGTLQETKNDASKPHGDGENVRKMINKFENFNEANHSPSMKFQKGGKINWLNKLSSPLKMKHTVSPSQKKKFADNLTKKFSKLSESTFTKEAKNGQNLRTGRYQKSDVQNSQRTILDIWGPEMSKVRPRSDN